MPSHVVQGTTEDEAKQAAAAIDPPIVGAVGFQIIRDNDGSVRTITIFGSIGEVPEGYAAMLFDKLTEAP